MGQRLGDTGVRHGCLRDAVIHQKHQEPKQARFCSWPQRSRLRTLKWAAGEGLEDADKTTVKPGSELHAEGGTGRQRVGRTEDQSSRTARALRAGAEHVSLALTGRASHLAGQSPGLKCKPRTLRRPVSGVGRGLNQNVRVSHHATSGAWSSTKLTQVSVINFAINQAKKTAKEALLLLLSVTLCPILSTKVTSLTGGRGGRRGNGDVAAHGGWARTPR